MSANRHFSYRAQWLAPLALALACCLAAPGAGADWVSHGPFCSRPYGFSAADGPSGDAYLTVGGRVFRSRDGWRSWHEVGDGLPSGRGYVPSVAVDPQRPERVFSAVWGNGVYRSLDEGESWQSASDGLHPELFFDRVFKPDSSSMVVAESRYDGIYRSDNLGITWADITPPETLEGNFLLLEPHPLRPRRLWVETFLGLYRSDDGGNRWHPAGSGLPADGVEFLTFDPGDPDRAFATHYTWLYRTDDATQWSRVGTPNIPTNTFVYPYALLAVPGDPVRLLVGQEGDGVPYPPGSPLDPGVLRSDDGGDTWEDGGLIGESVYELFYHSGTGRVIALTGSGAFVSYDLGTSWERTGAGIAAANVSLLAVPDGASGPVLLATVRECDHVRFARSSDGGRTWQTGEDQLSFSISGLAVAPSERSRVYASVDSVIQRSDDGGLTWREVGPTGNGAAAGLTVDPGDPDVLFASMGSSGGVGRSVDGGETWEAGLGPFEAVSAIAIDPRDGNRIFIGSAGADRYGVARSTDGGDTWLQLASVLNVARVSGLLIDLHDPDTVYVSFNRYNTPVHKSTDGGDTWATTGTLGTNVLIESLAADPATPGLLAAGTRERGVMRSDDGAASWEPWPDAVGEARVRKVAFDPRGRVFAAVAGRGVYTPGPPKQIEPCRRDAHTACLFDGAFEVRGSNWDFAFPAAERELRVMSFPGGRAESDQAVFFESFSPGNFEIGVKMVDACDLDPGHPNRAYWVFAGGLTNAGSEVSVEDTVTGAEFRWSNAPGDFPRSIGDTQAFPCADGTPAAPCEPSADTACLLAGRFRVTGIMYDFSDPPEAVTARVMSFAGGRAESSQAVFFDSFRPGNFEIGVKMVDGCDLVAGHPLRAYWAFYGGLTNAEAQVVITQRETGRTDEWNNRAGEFPRTAGRTTAFPCLD